MSPKLRVVAGGLSDDEPIVFSLQHPFQRIDVPASAVLQIAAHEWQCFPGVERGYRLPHVEITLAADIRARIYRLTTALADPKLGVVKIKMIVAGQCLFEPAIDEAIGAVPSFLLSVGGFEEAESLVASLNALRQQGQSC
jgi:hypothetical protein